MKNLLFSSKSGQKLLHLLTFALCILLNVHHQSLAQSGNATANKFSRLSTATHSNLEVTSSQATLGGDEFNSKNNLINNTTGASWAYLVGGSAWIEVKDNAATGGNAYKEGSYAGFVVDAASIDVLSNITIETYLGTTKKESRSAAGLVSVQGIFSGATRIGFWTTKKTDGGNNDFDRIRIEYGSLGVAGSRTVYYAEVVRYGTGPQLSCNTPTPIRLSGGSEEGFPVSIVAERTGVDDLCVGCAVAEQTSLIDSDPSTSAKISMSVGVSATASISVGTVGQVNSGGTFAGFDISNPKLLGVGVTGGLKIETFLAGASTGEFITGANLLNVSSAIVSGSERKVVGFKTTASFDEVRLTIQQTGVNLGTTQVFGLVLTNFCNDAALACNTPTAVRNPANSVFVDGRQTGVTSILCAGCAITEPDYAIDNDANTSARFVTALNTVATGSFAVTNALTSYGENSFAGFDIETRSLANATVFGTATIELLMNGVVVAGSGSGAIVLGANSALLNGTNRQILGVVAKAGITYNGVKITFDKGVGVDVGDIRIYGAIFQNNCAGTDLTCDHTFPLNLPSTPPVSGESNFPVVINIEKTGYTGTACAGCFVNNAANVISPSKTDYAELGNLLSGIGRSSISVYNPINTYPAGVVAGFTIRKDNFLVAATLFDQITITTYNNGIQQEQASGNALLDISVALQIFGTASDFYNVGFITKKPFDEVRISVASLLGLTDNYIKVYGAFVDTRTATVYGLRCLNTNPDVNVAMKGVQINGDVSTNDLVATGTVYGTPAAISGQTNPGPEVPVMNSDGSYTFLANFTGIYTFNVPVCVAGQEACTNETLTISVITESNTQNPPIADDDVAIVKGNATITTPVLTNVLINDGPGNKGGTLQTPTIEVAPAQGTAVIQNNGVSYTPNPGFYGEDIVTYKVCETPSGQCTTANLVITVLSPEAQNPIMAADDFISGAANQAITVNAAKGVLTNDRVPDGSTISAVAQNTSIPGVGTLVLSTNGAYTFTPAAGFKGAAAFVYTACNNQGDCQQATLYILLQSIPNLIPSIIIDATTLTTAVPQRDFLVKITELLGTPTTSQITFKVSRLSGFEISVPGITLSDTYQSGLSGSSVVNGITVHENAQWTFKQDSRFIFITSKPDKIISAASLALLGFRVKCNASVPKNTVQNITVTITAGSGGETNYSDNISLIQVKAE